MEIQDYIDQNKNLYINFFEYIDSHQDDSHGYQNLTDFLTTHDYLNNVESLTEFLLLICKVSNNHTRENNLIDKIYKILFFLKDNLIHNFTKVEIFNIFKGNKILLLFLLTNLIEIDDTIINLLDELDYNKYFYYLAKPFLDKEKQQAIEFDLSQKDDKIFENFEEKCKKGENDDFLCELIRNDEVEQFIRYVNQNVIPLNSVIHTSIFETNHFLLKHENKTTFIEYASFFGAIQIFQYLRLNSIELTESAWIYSIHSNNPELFSLFRENINLPYNEAFFSRLLKEAVKCHHNDIANYIIENYVRNKYMLNKFAFRYHNFSFLTCDMKRDLDFFSAIKYHHNKLAKIMMKTDDYVKLKINNGSALKLAANYNNQDIVDIFFPKIGNVIEKSFFKNNKKMEKIIIPPTIVQIKESAFQDCISLKEVVIPPSVTSIGPYAFNKCKLLNHVIIPPSVTKIESFAFDECPNLTDFQVDFDKTTDFGFCAYNGCQNFKITYQFINVLLFTSVDNKNYENLKNYFKKEQPYKIRIKTFDSSDYIGTHIRYLFRCDVVFLFIDSTKKINEQFLSVKSSVYDMVMCLYYFRIHEVIVVVDKMDDESVNYSKERFDEIKNEMTSIFIENGFNSNQFQFVPISENKHENIDNKSSNFSWWIGPTLAEVINLLKPPKRQYLDKLRFVVLYGPDTDDYDTDHILAGIVKSGVLSMPCYLNSASNEMRNANLLYRRDTNEKEYAYPGEYDDFTYFYYFPSKRDLLGALTEKLTRPLKCISFTATLIILNSISEIKVGWDPNIQFVGGYLKCNLVKIENGEEIKSVQKYERVKVTFEPSDFLALETYDDYPGIGIFSITQNNFLVAIGLISSVEKKKSNK